jgi:arylsulfatase A-like enzyme
MRRSTVGALILACLIAASGAGIGLRSLPARGGAGVDRPLRPPQPRPRPDIVLVTIDALRADHLSSYGFARLTSPAIDRFGSRAVVFSNAVAQAPYTKASVASLMSGLYPSSHRTITATVPFPEAMTGHPTTAPVTTDVLSSSITTLAEGLKAAGYRTLGFTANPFLIAPFGFGQGFDEFEFFPGGDFAPGRQLVDRALREVQESGPGPIFLWVHLMEPHSPYVPPLWTRGTFPLAGAERKVPAGIAIPSWLVPGSPRDLRRYTAAYDEEIAAADIAVDVLLRELGDLREMDHAVVVLTADHGEQFLDHGGWEHSDTLYDELIRVPLIVRAPQIPSGVINSQVQIVDLYPTLLQFAGANVPPGAAGRSLIPVLHRADGSRPAFSEISGVEYAVRDDGWKLMVWPDGRQALFNLRDDPREQHDLAAGQAARVRRMRPMIDRYLAAAIARGRGVSGERAPIDPRILERLRALGYVAR